MDRRTNAVRPDEIRRHNLSLILSHVHRDGSLTRAQLTQRLGMSRSTIGALVADLTQLGLVQEVVPGRGDGVGRPSHRVGPFPGGPFVVAADVNVGYVTLAAVGLGGAVLARETVAMPNQTGSAGSAVSVQVVASMIAEAVARFQDASWPSAMIAGVGVSVPGTVDRRTGRVGVAPNLGWHDADLGELIGDLVPAGVPVAVGNDADLAVLAEYQRGSARDCDDVVYLLGRTGVGAGIIVGGAPLRGHDGHAGEIGHNVVDATGPQCHCGKRGCMETYVGDGALLAPAGHRELPSAAAIDTVFAEARAGDPTALAAVRAVAESLGRGIANLLNTLNPQRVLLGGWFVELLSVARPELDAALARFALEAPKRSVTLTAPTFGPDSALIGAAEIAFEALLADPAAAASLSV